MLATTIEDVQEPADVERMDRSELIALIKRHEAMRSQWELRIRMCEEKEQLWKNLLMEMGKVLAATFQNCHNAISEQAEAAAKIAENMKSIGRMIEEA